jgi:L-alanine-DL-glutamate epimerase-like enolase superfamily enzyme
MDRRTFVTSLAAGTLSSLGLPAVSEAFPVAGVRTPEPLRRAEAALPEARIKAIRLYQGPNVMPLQIPLLQSSMVVAIDTDIGITGIGEGGTLDTIAPCAGRLIGKNPFEITRLWQDLYRAYHYPPGRERLHAMGALDLALWDLKGKALDVPVYELLGGMTRNYLECYTTGFRGGGPTLKERAAACMEAGWRYFRFDAASLGGGNNVYDARERVLRVAADCREAREGVGPAGNFAVDFHQRFNFTDALRCCRMIEEYAPFLVEDPVATDLFGQDIPRLRTLTSVPLAAGEEWGARYDFNRLVQNRDLDYIRVSLPNTGGITEMIRICTLCETHEVGIVPHFTGPIATAAQVHTLGAFPIPVVFEYNYETRPIPYLGEFVTFRQGKLYPNTRPGLGVTVNFDQLELVRTFTEAVNRPTYYRPDGSQITW